MKKTSVDIGQECAALFNQEDTLAYFDFQLACGDGPAVQGLCRIAHPKKSTCGKDYVSLVFIIDTPAAPDREKAITGLKRLGTGALEAQLPEIFSVVSVPPATCPQQMYIKQFDLLLKERFRASQEFVSRRLYPAVRDALCLRAGEFGWWEDMAKEKQPPSTAGRAEQQAAKTFLSRMRERFFGG